MSGSVITLIVTLVFAVVTLAICLLVGWKRGTFHSAVRFGVFLIAGICSVFFCFPLATLFSPYVYDLIEPRIILLLGEEVASLASVQALAFSIVTSLLAPLCYVVLFFLVDKVLLIPYFIVKHCCKNIGALHGFKGDKIIGLVLGLVLSVGIVFTALMPLSGYARFAEESLALLEQREPETEQAELQELASVADSPLLVADSVCGGEALFYVCAKDLKVSMETVETVVLALDYFDSISAGGLTTVLAVAKLALIFDDLSPEAARILNDILCEVGTETEILEDTIAATVGQVFIAFAEMSGDLTEEEATQEFASVNYMLTNLILDRETRVNEYIEMIGHSKVISKVIVEAANPESSNYIVAQTIVERLADVDKAEVKEAMDKFYHMYLKNTEVLNAIAQLLEIDAQY